MAKKVEVTDPGAGYSARDILSHAIGKKSDELTIDDVKGWVSKQGLATHDVSQVLKGAEHFFKSGSDYRIQDAGGYNVVGDDKGVKTASSRESGNKRGFNPGDLVGLGNNMSKFIGLVNRHKEEFKKAEAAPTTEPTAPTPIKEQEPVNVALGKPASTLAKGTTKKVGAKPTTQPVPTEPTLEQIVQSKKEGFSKTPYAKYVNMEQTNPELFEPNVVDEKLRQYAEKLHGALHEKRGNKGLFGVPTGGYSVYEKIIPEQKLGELMKDYESNLNMGYDIQPPHEDFITGERRVENSDAPESENELGTSMLTMGLLPSAIGAVSRGLGYAATSPTAQFLKYYLGKRGPVPGSGAAKMATEQALTKLSTKAGTTAASMVNKGVVQPIKNEAKPAVDALMKKGASKIKFPKMEAMPETDISRMLPPKSAKKLGTWGEYSPAQKQLGTFGTPVPKPRIKVAGELLKSKDIPGGGGNAVKVIPKKVFRSVEHKQAVDKASEAMQSESYVFKKGGKLSATTLMTGPTRHPKGGDSKIAFAKGGQLASPSRIVWGATEGALHPKYPSKKFGGGGLFDDVDLVPGSKKIELNKEMPKTESTVKGNYGTTDPKNAGDENLFKDSPVAGILNKAKYILPFIGEGLARKTLRNFSPTGATAANLMKGTVVDMPKPNFHLRYRQPTGPDIQSEIGGQKFADAQQKEKEADFATQNAASRIAQAQHNLQVGNQNEMFNTQQQNMASVYNNQLKAQMTGAIADTYRQPFLAGQHMLNTDISNGAFINDDKKISLATEMIKNPDAYGGINSPKVQSAYKYMAGQRTGAKGMKFKTKFAHA